ncbi:MAG: phosphatidylserine/phosphatidylglycerophosphate/cardiolipin synthase family protein [Haloferacaceae archaeon]
MSVRVGRFVAGLLALCLVCPAAAPAVGAAGADGDGTRPPRVVAVYPNPTAGGDAGEYVLVDPNGARNLTLSDGEDAVAVPAATEPVALTPDPDAAADLTDRRTVAAGLSLSNGGERLRLRRDGRTVDTLAYEDAPEAERYTPEGWRPFGYEPRDVRAFGPANATAFVLPDAPGVPVETLRSAEDRVLLAGYTLTSERVADALVAAARRSVTVRVLVEGEPVGGLSRREAAVLDRLTRNGVAVRVLTGPRERFAFHHPKYAVVDDRALVLTENWKPSGTGGRDNRGWGVRIDARPVAADLAGLFTRDFAAHDARRWTAFRRNRTFPTAGTAEGSYPSRFAPERVRPRRVRVLTAPGNAEGAVVDVVDGAERRVDVVQPSLGGVDTPLVRSLRRAAERGVRVRVLLSGAWYVEEENRALVERLNALASRRDIPLEARVADPNGRYGSVHAKGVVADDVALVGSLNWNVDAARENREVVLALTGEDVAAYYREVFAADWRGGAGTPPAGLTLVAAVAVGLALAYLRRRVSFD